jgi:hypothetical protein
MADAKETWLMRLLEGTLKEADDVLRMVAEDVLRKSFWGILLATLVAHGRTTPKAKHITNARLLEVLMELALPPPLRTPMAAAPFSITESTAFKMLPDVEAISSPT